MSDTASEPLSKRTLAGRIVGGLWAINFLLLVTDTFTFNGQSQVSIGLAVASVVLLLQR